MTMAVCFKCGEIKFGAFCPCEKCGQMPQSEDDRIISMAMTDHYFDMTTLKQIGEATKKNGKPPDLAPENREQIRQVFRKCDPKLPKIEKMLEADLVGTHRRKPWWKFW